VDDGTGFLVQYNTTTRFGTINYSTGQIALTANLSGINPRVHYSVNSDSTLVATTNAFGAQIGHLDPARTNDIAIGAIGNTYIGVSRNNPVTGTGTINASSGSVFSSADGGLTTELRFYMPSVAQDQIATGAFLNNANYSRTSLGGVGNRLGTDEHIATDHTLVTTGTNGPVGAFVPEGIYPFHALGLYNIYFADTTVPPVLPPVVPPAAPVVVPEEIKATIAQAQREAATVAYDWPYGLFEYDGYEGHWGNLSASDAIEDIYVPRWGVEERLDAAFGPRQGGLVPSGSSGGEVAGEDGTSTPGSPSVAEQEQDEDHERMANRARHKVGKSVQTFFYLYEPGTNVYSSLRIFGVPSADVPAFSPGQ